MALSEHEQQMLKEIEQSLLSEDPKFGAVVTDGDFAQSKGTVTLRGIAIVVIGLVLLVTGVALSQMSLWWLSLHPGIFSDGCRRHVDAARWW